MQVSAIDQFDIAIRVARCVVKVRDHIGLAIPNGGPSGKIGRRRHKNDHLGPIRLLRAQDRYKAAQASIGQAHAHSLDYNVLTLAKMVFLPQLRNRVGQGSHALTTVVFYVRITQEPHGPFPVLTTRARL
jgi:hypothetical protein